MYHNVFFSSFQHHPSFDDPSDLLGDTLKGPTPRLGTCGLNYLTVYKAVKSSSTSSSYNSKILLTYCCISINKLIMSYIIIYQALSKNEYFYFWTFKHILLIILLHFYRVFFNWCIGTSANSVAKSYSMTTVKYVFF